MELSGQRVLVMGLGRSGVAAARLAVARGARVVGIDLRTGLSPIDGVTLELGPHRRERFLEADLIVVSPGIPPRQADLQAAGEAGVAIVGELGFAAGFLEQPMIAITGTNGKSTVTWFTGQLLRAAGRRPFVGGNLGNPLCDALLADQAHDTLVVEVSSYQLELMGPLKPDVGVILNLSPDHLARHGDMAGYAAAKARLFAHMGEEQLAILPWGDALLQDAARPHGGRRGWLGGAPGVRRSGRRVEVVLGGERQLLSLEGFAVPGEHNLDNAATAAYLALAIGIESRAVAAALPGLSALSHRMEVVAELRGVRYVNDSKATNLDAARAGIAGLEQPAVVLLGGQGKPNPDGSLGFGQLQPHLERHRAVVAFGEAGPQITEELSAVGIEVRPTGTLADALALASELARPGDAVLLSPGCASFDAFDDFEHRGRAFAELVSR